MNANDEMTASINIENFKSGFRLGVHMMCDCFISDETNIFRYIE